MNGYVYEPRPSAYARAHTVLCHTQGSPGEPLGKALAEQQLKVTPGLMFAPGVTLEEVFDTLRKWRLIEIEGDHIRVLSW